MEGRTERVRRVMSDLPQVTKKDLDVNHGVYTYGSMMKGDIRSMEPFVDTLGESLRSGLPTRVTKDVKRETSGGRIEEIIARFAKGVVSTGEEPISPIQCFSRRTSNGYSRSNKPPELVDAIKKIEEPLPIGVHNPITPTLPPLKRPTKPPKSNASFVGLGLLEAGVNGKSAPSPRPVDQPNEGIRRKPGVAKCGPPKGLTGRVSSKGDDEEYLSKPERRRRSGEGERESARRDGREKQRRDLSPKTKRATDGGGDEAPDSRERPRRDLSPKIRRGGSGDDEGGRSWRRSDTVMEDGEWEEVPNARTPSKRSRSTSDWRDDGVEWKQQRSSKRVLSPLPVASKRNRTDGMSRSNDYLERRGSSTEPARPRSFDSREKQPLRKPVEKSKDRPLNPSDPPSPRSPEVSKWSRPSERRRRESDDVAREREKESTPQDTKQTPLPDRKQAADENTKTDDDLTGAKAPTPTTEMNRSTKKPIQRSVVQGEDLNIKPFSTSQEKSKETRPVKRKAKRSKLSSVAVGKEFNQLKRKMETTLAKEGADPDLFQHLAKQTVITCFHAGLAAENEAKEDGTDTAAEKKKAKQFYRYLDQKLVRTVQDGFNRFQLEPKPLFYEAVRAKAAMREMALDTTFNTSKREECQALRRKLGAAKDSSVSSKDGESGDSLNVVSFTRGEAVQMRKLLEEYTNAMEKLEVVMGREQEAGAECKVS